MDKLRDIMKTDFHAIPNDATISGASKMMALLDVGMLPVVEDKRLTGVITDRDIVVRCIAEGHNPSDTLVSDVMTLGCIYLSKDTDITIATRVMEEMKVRRLVVTDSGEDVSVDAHKAIGMVSLGDLALREYQEPGSERL